MVEKNYAQAVQHLSISNIIIYIYIYVYIYREIEKIHASSGRKARPLLVYNLLLGTPP